MISKMTDSDLGFFVVLAVTIPLAALLVVVEEGFAYGVRLLRRTNESR